MFPPEMKTKIHINWRRQTFTYQPHTRLQAAFYYLLQNSALAKVCAQPECIRRYFIGNRTDERYCSDTCFRKARLEAKKNWWNESGKEWRAARTTGKTKEKKR